MATLWITEYDQIMKVPGGFAQVGREPGTDSTVTFTTSAQSGAFADNTVMIRVQASAGCYLKFGADPTATATSKPLAADVPEYFGVQAGHKVAAYDGTS